MSRRQFLKASTLVAPVLASTSYLATSTAQAQSPGASDFAQKANAISEKLFANDGLAIPIIALSHDIGHYDTYTEGCDQSSSYLRELKKFASFANERYDKSILYGIYLILFIFTHENYCKDFETEKNDTKHYSKEFIYKGLFDSMSAFRLLNWFGLAIPKAYRIIQKPGELQEEKIDEYLRKISELYALRYAEFKKSQASSGGRRKRMTRKKRVGRKQKKSRRSVKRH